MNPMRRVLTIAIAAILGSCSKGLPPLRTWEVGEARIGSNEIGFSFKAPHRVGTEPYWDYQLGIVLPQGVNFDLSGEVKITSLTGEARNSFRFDSATNSSWLNDQNRSSHLLAGKLGIRDGEGCHVELRFDRPLKRDTQVVLHFLSHTDTPPQLIQENHKPAKPMDSEIEFAPPPAPKVE
jgi:hypothetical protein